MFPTASIFRRAFVVPTFGRVTDSEPSFGVLAARTCGYVRPPSVERLILTAAVLTGGRFVFATFHITFCVEEPAQVTAVFGAVTRNGPAVFASSTVVSALLTPPRPSRAVRRKCSDSGALFSASAEPTYDAVGRNSEKHSVADCGTG